MARNALRARAGFQRDAVQIIDRSRDVFDAVVVGSGATGGWAAKQLTEAGLRVCVLEAGPRVSDAEFSEHVQPYELKYRGRQPIESPRQPVQRQIYACRESNSHWFVDDVRNPYTTAEGKPFLWIRQRVVGGRTLSWGRQSYRLSDLDFKAASHDGYGDDWPISYNDLAPYYDRVERYVGVSGQVEGLAQLPDGSFLPPMPMTCAETLLRRAVTEKMGRTVTIGRSAVLTQPHNGRAACHYCGPCEQGCATHSYFSSPATTLKDAAATGRLTLQPDAVVSHVTMDRAAGRASGVAYIERLSRRPREARGKIVILCASALESTRILLNSAPGGLANSSGVLGHYLMDHVYHGRTTGEFPQAGPARAWFGPPRRPNGIYIPRFRNVTQSHTNGMIRGYGYQGGARPEFDLDAPGFGAEFKRAVRQGPWRVSLGAFNECLARYDNFVEIDPEAKDAWGIPALRMDMSWSDNELKLWHDAQQQGAEMLEAAGAANIRNSGSPSAPGLCIHEVGTARMGHDARSSVVNSWGQAHDVTNLFVTDGAVFVSSACQNPTLTMMAFTVRSCDHIAERARRGEFA